MELSYWESRWRKGKTGFHMPDGYSELQEHWGELNLPENPVVLVPLCGKSVDMIWLEQKAAKVIGVEISEEAILSFFKENDRDYICSSYGVFTIYQSGAIELWCGDFLKTPQKKLPPIDLIYDKAALVALPLKMRESYVNKLLELNTSSTNILLHHFEYPQNEMPGPPFSVPFEEIKNYFSDLFSIFVLNENSVKPSDFSKFERRGLSSPMKERFLQLKPIGVL